MNSFMMDTGQEEILERIPIVIIQDGNIVAEFESVVNHKTSAGRAKEGVMENPAVPAAMRDNPDDCQMVFVDDEKNVKEEVPDDESMLKYAVRLAHTAYLEIVTRKA